MILNLQFLTIYYSTCNLAANAIWTVPTHEDTTHGDASVQHQAWASSCIPRRIHTIFPVPGVQFPHIVLDLHEPNAKVLWQLCLVCSGQFPCPAVPSVFGDRHLHQDWKLRVWHAEETHQEVRWLIVHWSTNRLCASDIGPHQQGLSFVDGNSGTQTTIRT